MNETELVEQSLPVAVSAFKFLDESIKDEGEPEKDSLKDKADSDVKPNSKKSNPKDKDSKASAEDTSEPEEKNKTEPQEAYSPLKEDASSEPDQKEGEKKKENNEDVQKVTERLNAAKSSFLKTSYKLSEAIKFLDSMENQNVFSDEEESSIKKLREILSHEAPSDLLSKIGGKPSSPLSDFFNVVNPEIENIRKYSDDENIDNYLISFNRWLLSDGSKQDQEDILDLMNEFKEDASAQAKRAVAIGKKLYHDVYKSIKNAGGVPNLVKHYESALAKKESELEELRSRLDKKAKKEEAESDFIPSKGYRLNSIKDPSLVSGSELSRKKTVSAFNYDG